MDLGKPGYEALVVMGSALAERARGRDAVDLALACLALGWQTALLLVGPAREWLHAQGAAAVVGGPDPFPRALASLPLYELAAVHVLAQPDDPHLTQWSDLGQLPVQVLAPSQLPGLLRATAHVFHP